MEPEEELVINQLEATNRSLIRTIAVIVQQAGGEIVIPKALFESLPEYVELSKTYDTENESMILRATAIEEPEEGVALL